MHTETNISGELTLVKWEPRKLIGHDLKIRVPVRITRACDRISRTIPSGNLRLTWSEIDKCHENEKPTRGNEPDWL
jgi:hypothetical protein